MEKETEKTHRHRHDHEETVGEVRAALPPEDALIDLAELYKTFGDSTRIKILYALFESELCVCGIAGLLGMTLSAISHQLRILRGAKLVDYRREGRTLYYFLADDHVRTILGQGMEHIGEDARRNGKEKSYEKGI